MKRMTREAFAVAAALILTGTSALAAEVKPEEVLASKCGACHDLTATGTRARIGEVRKTPEGWAMTVDRMVRWHGLALSAGEEPALIKHLADTQGLAPEEALPYRYVLERRHGIVETPDDPELASFCARCHTYARVGLQRRNAGDWLKLANMHLGQWPTLEYQAMARDREWWKLASTEVPKKLGEKWPLETAAWAEWSKRKPVDLSGVWRVAGHRPGTGAYSGTLTAKRTGADQYKLSYDLVYANGSKVTGQGASVVYTGYEWRGSVKLGKDAIDEVYAVAADGRSLAGRWYLAREDGIGADLKAVRADQPAILAIEPAYVKAGGKATLTIIGSGLKGGVDFGPGIVIDKVVKAGPDSVTVQVSTTKDSATGPRPVAVGDTRAAGLLTLYDKVDHVRVEPATAVARIGGNGGPLPQRPAQFEAVGYMAGPDGKPGTEDDVRIATLPAEWMLANFDAAAEEANDAKFGGRIDKAGLFMPGQAGLNKARGGLFNNFANLSVKATIRDGDAKLEGSGHLFVAPPRWVDAPIR